MALATSFCRSLSGPRTPGSSGSMPGRAFFSMASACSGMSGRLQASGAGDRSSVLVSPLTLNTVTVSEAGTAGRSVNHSASAQDWMTRLGVCVSGVGQLFTSLKASNTRSVCLRPLAATAPTSASASSSISGLTLNPPSIVPRSSVARTREMSAIVSSPLATFARNSALTSAASSTPAGTRLTSRSTRNSASPAAERGEGPEGPSSGRRKAAAAGCRARRAPRRAADRI